MHQAASQLLLLPPVRPLAERFGREFFRDVPDAPGVYLMCGPSDGVLYVGKARNLRQRLGSYRSANPERLPRKLRRLLIAVERIHWDICRDEQAAIARERELLLALRPRFNTVGTYPAPQLQIGWQRTSRGLALGIGGIAEGWEDRHGPFTRMRPVFAALIRLVWRACHPTLALHAMSSRLVRGDRLSNWLFSTPSIRRDDWLEHLASYLRRFWRGDSVDLVEWLHQSGLPDSRFEEQWRAQDAETLLEFFEGTFRHPRKGATQ